MRRRLSLFIDFHSGFECAEDYHSTCASKYVLDDDQAWDAYVQARNEFVKQFENVRKLAKRAPVTSDDLALYDQESDNY
jgi:hypothetical protein